MRSRTAARPAVDILPTLRSAMVAHENAHVRTSLRGAHESGTAVDPNMIVLRPPPANSSLGRVGDASGQIEHGLVAGQYALERVGIEQITHNRRNPQLLDGDGPLVVPSQPTDLMPSGQQMTYRPTTKHAGSPDQQHAHEDHLSHRPNKDERAHQNVTASRHMALSGQMPRHLPTNPSGQPTTKDRDTSIAPARHHLGVGTPPGHPGAPRASPDRPRQPPTSAR